MNINHSVVNITPGIKSACTTVGVPDPRLLAQMSMQDPQTTTPGTGVHPRPGVDECRNHSTLRALQVVLLVASVEVNVAKRLCVFCSRGSLFLVFSRSNIATSVLLVVLCFLVSVEQCNMRLCFQY